MQPKDVTQVEAATTQSNANLCMWRRSRYWRCMCHMRLQLALEAPKCYKHHMRQQRSPLGWCMQCTSWVLPHRWRVYRLDALTTIGEGMHFYSDMTSYTLPQEAVLAVGSNDTAMKSYSTTQSRGRATCNTVLSCSWLCSHHGVRCTLLLTERHTPLWRSSPLLHALFL